MGPFTRTISARYELPIAPIKLNSLANSLKEKHTTKHRSNHVRAMMPQLRNWFQFEMHIVCELCAFVWLFNLRGNKFRVNLISINRFGGILLRMNWFSIGLMSTGVCISNKSVKIKSYTNKNVTFVHGNSSSSNVIVRCLLRANLGWAYHSSVTPCTSWITLLVCEFVFFFFSFVNMFRLLTFNLIIQRHKCNKCARCSSTSRNETKNVTLTCAITNRIIISIQCDLYSLFFYCTCAFYTYQTVVILASSYHDCESYKTHTDHVTWNFVFIVMICVRVSSSLNFDFISC